MFEAYRFRNVFQPQAEQLYHRLRALNFSVEMKGDKGDIILVLPNSQKEHLIEMQKKAPQSYGNPQNY